MSFEMSRSEQKRRVKQLEKLVAELSSLPAAQIDQLPCTDEVRTLFHEAAAIKGGARNRHIRYITKLLKTEPVEELYSFLSEKKGKALQKNKEFHELEYLREELLSEAIEQHRVARHNHEELEENWPSTVAEKICREYSGVDRTLLTRLAWMFARTRNSRHSREVFRLLRAAQEKAVYEQAVHSEQKG